MKIMKYSKFAFALVICVCCNAIASVSSDSIDQIGNSLTLTGAEKSGNAAGSIPAWTGGLTANAGQLDKRGFRSNPFSGERALFTISSANYQQYKDQLTPGQIALFETYADTFEMPIYQTHRSTAYPEHIYQETKKNALNVQLANNGNGLEGYSKGIPFPIPQSGLEVIWNHLARYQGEGIDRNIMTAAPRSDGSFTPSVLSQQFSSPWALTDAESAEGEIDNILLFYKWKTISPSRSAGQFNLVHETLNQVKQPRLAWVYSTGQRRLRRAPQIAYDAPSTAGDGQHTTDNYQLYNGAPDKYDWKLLGKKEIYVPYNAYKLSDTNLKYTDIIKPQHLNPDHLRYELHRVWQVEATLKDGARHIYNKRVFFVDEDSWTVVLVDQYDKRGNLWRVSEGHLLQVYDQFVPSLHVETCYDLSNGRYFVGGLQNEMSKADDYNYRASLVDFSPSQLRRVGVR